jgi:flagellar basal-body rod protein FlgC
MQSAFDISVSGLVAQRQRMNVIAGNIANVNSTQDPDGNTSPFRRRIVEFAADVEAADTPGGAIDVSHQVKSDYTTPFREVYSPGHPDANEEGIVLYPNMNLITESINMMEAARAYQANIAAIQTTSEMSNAAYKILG